MIVLSTKKLLLNQKELLLNAGVTFVEYDSIKIDFVDFELPQKVQLAIFTSQNGVISFLNSQSGSNRNWSIEKIFCVGDKTKKLLEENGLKVVKTAQNSSELGSFIAKRYKNEQFYYFCGSKRRNELPEIINASENELFEVKTYKTTLNSKKFDQNWDGILFFSPSGVASFTMNNKMNNSVAFCIGNTTASEAKKHTDKIVLANTTTVESVIAKAVKTLRK
ncbi:uroporphyrinogen-III synthase [Jejudonia soesokkakensis]|uniref:Uroporphyrinogen-III synthase n=1 Tax=Jejudonia soesokkakensis TaxID=1323432 RepID=A0ABW2MNG8_9FLAO